MVDTTLPTAVRVFTQETADGKAVYVAFPPNEVSPMLASPVFDTALPDFDKTINLPTGA